MKDYGAPAARRRRLARPRRGVRGEGPRRDRAPRRGRAARPARTRCRCASPTTTPATSPTRRASAQQPRDAAARDPRPRAARARRVGDLLRLGGRLQPARARGRRASSGERKARNLLATGAEADRGREPRAAPSRSPPHARAPLPVLHPLELLDASIAEEERVHDGLRGPRAPMHARLRRGADRRRAGVRRRAARARFDDTPPRAARARAPSARPSSTRAARSTSSTRRATCARATGRSRRRRRPCRDRRVEITGPDRAQDGHQRAQLGRRGFMADFEDANSPDLAQHGRAARSTCIDADRGHDRPTTGPTAASTSLDEDTATLLVRPRGWHLPEKHLRGGRRAGGRRARGLRPVRLPQRARAAGAGSGPYFYLPKLESHREARAVERRLRARRRRRSGSPRGTIRATVLIETLPAAFEMDEILYELREPLAPALNAGRWDYIFSTIKCFRDAARVRAARTARP